MGQYTSYWLYQKYEKRGSQEAIPVYPNVYSVDGDGTMPKVVKTENDTACGYVPTGTTQYRWVNLDPSVDYYCDECPTPQYRWTNSGTTCVGYDKYQRAIKQVSYDNGQTWENVSPAEYSATTLIQADSPDCGYVEPIYRWIKSDDTICVEATAQYRTISGTPYCTGYDKYVDVYSQVSYDSGSTWTTTATTPTLVEADSEDCGYVPPTPPTPTGAKFSATYNDGRTFSRECDSGTSLYRSDVYVAGYSLTAMTSIIIGDCVTDINAKCFGGYEQGDVRAKSLTSVTIPDSVTIIGSAAFFNCTSLTHVSIGSGLTYIGGGGDSPWGAFGACYSLTSIGEKGSGASVEIPDTVTKIGGAAFYGCTGLTSVRIPNSVTAITQSPFQDCRSLTSVTIPNSITTIGANAFYGCSSLTSIGGKGSGASIEIPDSVTEIDGQAFEGCSSLTSVTIPSSVTSIGMWAFYRCTSLTSVTCLATVPPTLGYKDVFDNTNDCPIYVPSGSVEAYKSAEYWSKYASRIQPIP